MSRDYIVSTLELLILAGVFAAIGYGIGGIAGEKDGIKYMEREAVKRGHAEYVLVNRGPETKFVWKEGR